MCVIEIKRGLVIRAASNSSKAISEESHSWSAFDLLMNLSKSENNIIESISDFLDFVFESKLVSLKVAEWLVKNYLRWSIQSLKSQLDQSKQ